MSAGSQIDILIWAGLSPESNVQEEDVLTEGSEVERPQGLGEGASEIGSERRYATRQATRKQQTGHLSSLEPDRVSSHSPFGCRENIIGKRQFWLSAASLF